MSTHELKTHPEYFRKVWNGKKTAELRFDDRDFMIGDTVILKEFRKIKGFTGRACEFKISDITRLNRLDANIDHRWVMLSMGPVNR